MPNNRQDFVGPILLAIFAYLASMLTRAFQRSLEENVSVDPSELMPGRWKKEKTIVHVEHTVVDNFITDQSKLNKLQDSTLWEDCVASGPKWFTKGVEKSNKPMTIWEELTEMIWEQRPEYKDAIGFEYWCDIFTETSPVAWHIDKDEVAFEQTNQLITPIMGAVYYGFNHTLFFGKGGGHLQLIDADFHDNPLEFDVVRREEIMEISPDFNRLVIFNSSKWHKVTRVAGGGTRYAFVSNAKSHVPKVSTKQGKIDSA